jgi:hypothetical protein
VTLAQSAHRGTVWLRKTDSPQRLAVTNQLDSRELITESSIFRGGDRHPGLAVRYPFFRGAECPPIKDKTLQD